VAPSVAEIVAELVHATTFHVTVKVALVVRVGTVTLGGTVAAAELLLERVTDMPPDGAADVRVMTPLDEFPPGLHLSHCSG
jgi:hypothetical protein